MGRLSDSFHVDYLDIKDETGRHIHHRNFDGGLHLKAVIVSIDFKDLTLIERHQLVYDALGTLVKNEIHALSMKTFTPSEWEETLQNPNV